jgi:hypothetical protein
MKKGVKQVFCGLVVSQVRHSVESSKAGVGIVQLLLLQLQLLPCNVVSCSSKRH